MNKIAMRQLQSNCQFPSNSSLLKEGIPVAIPREPSELAVTATADEKAARLFVHDALLVEQEFLMHITVKASLVPSLKRLVESTCRGLVLSMRIQPIDHERHMKILLCLRRPAVNQLMDTIMHTLPEAAFGRIASV